MEWRLGEYCLSDDPARLDLDAIHDLLRGTYWAKDRPRPVTEQAVRGSFCLGLFLGAHQVGFARAVTDHATFAWISDVIVHPDHRGRGLGKWLVKTLIDHPRLQVRSQYLATEDAHALYERHGFTRFETLKRHPIAWPAVAVEGEADASGSGREVGAGESGVRLLEGEEHLEAVAALFREYASGLGFSLCFQGFDEELATLPGRYARPGGRLFLLEVNGRVAGGVGLRPLEGGTAEVKRLFVRAEFRGRGLGRRLVEAVLEAAREAGYGRVVLDTLPSMVAAGALYRRLGFRETAPYMPHPVDGSVCLEKWL